MSSRLCWTLLALVYFWINPFLRRRSSIHPVLKSLKSTAFFCHHIRFLSRSLAGRNWLQLNKVSCIIHALIPPGFLEQVITILFHPVQACSYMDNMFISCSLWNPVFSVCVCMCACMRFQQFLTWISGYDRRLGTEHFYVILLFLWFLLPFSCLSILISLSDAVFALSAWTWLEDLLTHLLQKHIFCFSAYPRCSLSNHVPPHCTIPFLFLPVLLPICSLSKEFHIHCWSYWWNSRWNDNTNNST